MDYAFAFAEKKDICTDGSYPYTAKYETCNLLEVGIDIATRVHRHRGGSVRVPLLSATEAMRTPSTGR